MDGKIFEDGWEGVGGQSEWVTEGNQMKYYMVSESK